MSIFHSIRGRLIAGFTLLTLLTVTLLGVLVLSLMQRYVAQQEISYLEQNAVALARQTERYFTAPLSPPALSSLVRTASLLGDFQVRILDANEEALVDSAQAAIGGQLTWVVASGASGLPPELSEMEFMTDPELLDVFFIDAGGVGPWGGPVRLPAIEPQVNSELDGTRPYHPLSAQEQLPHILRIIRQRRSEWGPLLHFEAASEDAFIELQRARPAQLSEIIVAKKVTDTLPAVLPTALTTERPAVPIATAEIRPFYRLLQRVWPRLPRQQVTTPIETDHVVVGYVELSSTPGIATEALAALRRLFVLAAAGVSLLAMGVGLVMSRSLTAPIQLLTEATGRMNSGDLSARAAVRGNDEIGQLATAFNRMAGALEQSFRDLAAERDALRHFVADASHELRTPITALRTFTELLRDDTTDNNTHAEFLAESALQVQRLERITENLLNLSRFDGGLVELRRSEVPVAELLTHVVELVRPLAGEKALALTIELPADTLTLNCDRPQIERALTNLLENAIKFTPPSGLIRIGAAQRAGRVTIWVEDTGIGISTADQAEIFRRFYRGQNATHEGSGLGLAIVQSIMAAHGGEVHVESEEGKGSRFTLGWPV